MLQNSFSGCQFLNAQMMTVFLPLVKIKILIGNLDSFRDINVGK
jgi:hypothetical protein